MHKPDHASVLPDHLAPIPMPDSPREAEMLLILLEAGLYPKIVPAQSEKIKPGQGKGLASRSASGCRKEGENS
jgi:hypothetical protein